MKLQDNEKQEILNIVSDYKSMSETVYLLERDLEELMKRKTEALNKLDKVRSSESEVMEQLKAKYGQGYLDIKALEWITYNL